MKVMRQWSLWLFLGSFLTYSLFVIYGPRWESTSGAPPEDRVVVTAPLQLLLYMGDRYLAANVETIRLAATGMEINPATGTIDGRYLLRAHQVVTDLNACHEDNYYLANAILAWAGASQEANETLWAAAECRHWDFLPPFLYGFNKYFFSRDIQAAQKGLEIAADRDEFNASSIRRFSIMIATEELNDVSAAIAYLEEQRKQTTSKSLVDSLQKRIVRLEGLVTLQEAHSVYEQEYGEELKVPQALLDKGILDAYPVDPLGVGYEFVDGQFKLRQLTIQGVERPQ